MTEEEFLAILKIAGVRAYMWETAEGWTGYLMDGDNLTLLAIRQKTKRALIRRLAKDYVKRQPHD